MPKEQMNKLCGKTLSQWHSRNETLAGINNFILERTVRLEVRSIDQLKKCAPHHPQSEGKDMLQTHYM